MADLLFNIEKDYGWVLLSVVWIGFQCLIHGFIYGGGSRKKTFTKELLQQKFGDDHKKMCGQEIKAGGYPDTGSGKYSQALSYEAWYKYNCAQRIHMNYVEGIATIVILLLVNGLFHSCCAATLGFAYIVGRQLVAFGYNTGKGFNHPLRLVGILMVDISILANFVMANYALITRLLA